MQFEGAAKTIRRQRNGKSGQNFSGGVGREKQRNQISKGGHDEARKKEWEARYDESTECIYAKVSLRF